MARGRRKYVKPQLRSLGTADDIAADCAEVLRRAIKLMEAERLKRPGKSREG